MTITISKENRKKIENELKWRFHIKANEIEEIIEHLIKFIDSIEEIIEPVKIEPVTQSILKLVYEYGIPKNTKNKMKFLE